MNKQKNRYVSKALPSKYRMTISEFCMLYGLSLQVVMHRLNITNWADFDALVVPTDLLDTKPPLIKRALKMIDMGWSDNSIAKRLSIPYEHVARIRNLSPYEKEIYSDSKYYKNYFFLNPETIDVDKIFRRRSSDEITSEDLVI